MATTKLRTVELACAFCGKDQDNVRHLLAGASGVHICGECVAAADLIIKRETSRVGD